MSLAVLLRNGTHAAATERYILKCDNASIQVAKTPIQIPIPKQSPQLIDIGVYRPNITLTGVVDTLGGVVPTGRGATALNEALDDDEVGITVDSVSNISIGDVVRLDHTPTTTTAEDVDDGAETDIDMASGANIDVGMILRIGNEDMKVTAVSTNTISVLRGVNGTSKAASSSGATVHIPRKVEEMDVTGISSVTLTVVRGVNGTTAQKHADNTAIESYGTAFFNGLTPLTYTRTSGYGASNYAKTYYVPHKNKLEDLATFFVYSPSTPLELEIGNANDPVGSIQTGGAVYFVALQNIRFQVDAAKEDRFGLSMQFVVTSRKDA